MSIFEKGYDTNHIMNFIFGFLVSAVIANMAHRCFVWVTPRLSSDYKLSTFIDCFN